jgi:hypothetical protein
MQGNRNQEEGLLSDFGAEASEDLHPYTYDVIINEVGIQINLAVDGALIKRIQIDGRGNTLDLSIHQHGQVKPEYRHDLIPPRQIEDRIKRI